MMVKRLSRTDGWMSFWSGNVRAVSGLGVWSIERGKGKRAMARLKKKGEGSRYGLQERGDGRVGFHCLCMLAGRQAVVGSSWHFLGNI